MFPGILASLLLAVFAMWLGQTGPVRTFGIGALVLAFIIGSLIRIPLARLPSSLLPGLGWSQTRLLRWGVALLGLQITWQQVTQMGAAVILVDLVVVTSILGIGYLIGTRLLKLPPPIVILTCAGSAICGAAAVVATNSMVKAHEKDMAVAVSIVVLFGTLGMFLYPLWYPHAAMPANHFGVYIGATVHEVAQVVAAGASVSNDAMHTAVVVKLIRVLALLPWLFFLSMTLRRQEDTSTAKAPIPWFVFGFVALVALNSLLVWPESLHKTLVMAGNLGLTAAMGAIGLHFDVRSMGRVGWKPFALGGMLFLMLAFGGFGLVRVLI